MRTLAIWIFLIAYLSNTVAVFGPDEYGGGSIFFGNFGYQFDSKDP